MIINELIKTFQEKGIIERISSSLNKVESFKAEQFAMKETLDELKDTDLTYYSWEISSQEAVVFFTICMMAGIDYKKLIKREKLEAALREAAFQRGKRKKKNIASRMMFYIHFRKLFSEDTLEELIVRFF